jgi:DNA adenine methylase
MKSPIRYYGGKGGMYKKILAEFPLDFGTDVRTTNDGSADIYIEPYGGSAVVLLQKKPSPIEIYNDLNSNVYSLFKVLSDKKLFQEFQNMCALTYYSRRLADEYRESLKQNELSTLDRAFRFFYVNRVTYNGVGGFSCIVNAVRRGMSKPVSDMLSTIDRLPEIHERLRSVIIENKDAIQLLEKYDKPSALFYLDPPYHHDTRTSVRYDIDMADDQQEELVDVLLDTTSARVLLSGYQCEEYNRLTDNGWHRVDIEINTQTSKREKKTKTESLWRNYLIEKSS